MCTRYVSPDAAAVERVWKVGRDAPWQWPKPEVFPGYPGAFIRAARDSEERCRELVLGQWDLIPWFAETPKLKYATSNARSEEVTSKASYKHPCARGQRCIIPAESFYEPNCESGKHIPWRFRRADGEPWGLAGLWNIWVDKATGEIHQSYTMLTLHADHYALMKRMHRPDPKRPPEMQDKRSVVAIERDDVDVWLCGTSDEATACMRLPALDLIDAAPAQVAR